MGCVGRRATRPPGDGAAATSRGTDPLVSRRPRTAGGRAEISRGRRDSLPRRRSDARPSKPLAIAEQRSVESGRSVRGERSRQRRCSSTSRPAPTETTSGPKPVMRARRQGDAPGSKARCLLEGDSSRKMMGSPLVATPVVRAARVASAWCEIDPTFQGGAGVGPGSSEPDSDAGLPRWRFGAGAVVSASGRRRGPPSSSAMPTACSTAGFGLLGARTTPRVRPRRHFGGFAAGPPPRELEGCGRGRSTCIGL